MRSSVYKYCFLIALFLGISAGTGWAQQTHTVKPGETLYSIAKEYELTVQDLRTWNKLQGNALEVGQTLIVSNPKGKQSEVHTVQPHETLFSISKQYNVSISELKSWNDLSGNALNVGQKLKIYSSGSASSKGKSAAEPIVVNKKAEQNTYYTVKSGDTLYKIARGHNMTLAELKKLNDLSSNTISVGQKLTVREVSAPPSVATSSISSSPQGKFVTYKVKGTQSLDQILQKYKMDQTEFAALNPDISSTTFRTGQKLVLLAPPTKHYKNPYTTQANLKDLGQTAVSEYGSSEKGKTTTSGELYNPDQLTAAHSNIALGTVIFIQNPRNKKGIFVRINDRTSSTGLKLSEAAWDALGFTSAQPTVNIYQNQ